RPCSIARPPDASWTSRAPGGRERRGWAGIALPGTRDAGEREELVDRWIEILRILAAAAGGGEDAEHLLEMTPRQVQQLPEPRIGAQGLEVRVQHVEVIVLHQAFAAAEEQEVQRLMKPAMPGEERCHLCRGAPPAWELRLAAGGAEQAAGR